jgi:NADPH:quinone reductase-like Zn-dependent oxidoreductase
MKAIQYKAFGGPEVLTLNEIEKPVPQNDEVLVKIISTTINPFDMKVRSGNMQSVMPVNLPYTPGTDLSGIVESVGNNVSRLKIGDEVFATTFGSTYTEYIALKEAQVGLKPQNISFNEAAALAVPVVTSYSVLIETAKLQAGTKMLIHGAAGAVGSTMVQMAKALNCYVIGTATGEGISLLKKLDADEVIDYKIQDFTKLVSDVDLVADLVGGETQNKSFSIIKKGGKMISTVNPPSQELAKTYDVEAQFISSTPSFLKLDFGSELIKQGKIKPQIVKVMKLEEAAEAQALVSAGGINGKIILDIN